MLLRTLTLLKETTQVQKIMFWIYLINAILKCCAKGTMAMPFNGMKNLTVVVKYIFHIFHNHKYHAIQNGKWDTAFKLIKVENTGFDFKGSTTGNNY